MPAKRVPKPEAPAALPRRRVLAEAISKAVYFADATAKTSLQFVSSGCAVMDASLGGGYVLGRVANIVGDKSSGKTLQAMEVLANFHQAYPKGFSRYAEAEAAFDLPYAAALGMPIDKIEFNQQGKPVETVEDLYDDLVRFLDRIKGKGPGVYIVDSLDALSDADEMEEKDFNKGSYGGKKPKQIGKLFRLLVDRLEEQQVLFIVISQIRDKIGVTFGETKTRSGGKALDFYASQIVWLAEIGKIKRTIDGVERVTGVDVRAKVKKNKIGLPFRECDYPILFGYGIDDLKACVDWMLEVGLEERLKSEFGLTKAGHGVKLASLRNKGGEPARELRAALRKAVFEEWKRIELKFLPQASKY